VNKIKNVFSEKEQKLIIAYSAMMIKNHRINTSQLKSWLMLAGICADKGMTAAGVKRIIEEKTETIKARYKIVNGSVSGHCCFDYSIIDTRPDQLEKENQIKDIELWGGVMRCECFYYHDAECICEAMNMYEEKLEAPE
jgi:hypothetical protein